jgi:hypothetical protein
VRTTGKYMRKRGLENANANQGGSCKFENLRGLAELVGGPVRNSNIHRMRGQNAACWSPQRDEWLMRGHGCMLLTARTSPALEEMNTLLQARSIITASAELTTFIIIHPDPSTLQILSTHSPLRSLLEHCICNVCTRPQTHDYMSPVARCERVV